MGILDQKIKYVGVKWVISNFRFYVYLFFLFFLGGCEMSENKNLEYFKSQISSLLGDSNSVEAVASDMTDFSWDKLCFERNESLTLTFSSANSEVFFELDYKDYFVDEAYVEGSLDRKCISSQDRLLIKKKYPGYSETIGFFSIGKYAGKVI